MKTLSKSPSRFDLRAHPKVARYLVFTVLVAFVALPAAVPAVSASPGAYGSSSLKGTYVWSGLLKFGAPLPIPGLFVDGAPPHDQVSPGEVVGIWAAILGTMTFDGSGNVTDNPKPGWKPSREKLAVKRPSGQVTRKSAITARPSPPPTAAPCTAATTGVSARNSRTASR